MTNADISEFNGWKQMPRRGYRFVENQTQKTFAPSGQPLASGYF